MASPGQSALTTALLTDLAEKLDRRIGQLPHGGQTELAARLGMERAHLLKIVKTKKARLETVVEIAVRLGITIEHDGFVIGPILPPSRREQ